MSYRTDKNRTHSVLFRKAYGLQAKELNAVQDNVQEQIGSIGRYLFKNGAAINGGGIVTRGAITLAVETNFDGSPVDLSQFLNKQIDLVSDTDRIVGYGTCFATSESTSDEPACIHVVRSSNVDASSMTRVVTTDGSYAELQSGGIYNCLYAVLRSGNYFYNGYSVPVDMQTIVVSKFNSTPSGSIGIKFEKLTITGRGGGR